MKTLLALASIAVGIGVSDAGPTHGASVALSMLVRGCVTNCGGGGGPPPPPPPTTGAPVSLLMPQIVGLDYPNNGSSTALSGSTTTLTADVGTWTNSPTSYTFNWHTVDAPGTSLGTGGSVTLTNSAHLNQAIVVDVTATNSLGSATKNSHWFGPLETALPPAPPTPETAGGSPSLAVPAEPAHFLQNGHALVPGCVIPPVAPAHTASGDTHVWYFDPVNGKTQAAGATGHTKATAFRDITALFNTVTGYPSGGLFQAPGFIQPGDTVYLEPGWGGANPVGDIDGTGSNQYSTSDGTSTGAIAFTWIMGDPAAASTPVLHKITFGSGNGGAAGFVFKNFNIERHREGNLSTGALVALQGQASTVVHDMLFENINLTTWLGHSGDPIMTRPYPNSGGLSDGTIVTASPVQATTLENGVLINGTAAAHSTIITLPSKAPGFNYVWSPGLYNVGASVLQSPGTGIPSGSEIKAIGGIQQAHYTDKGTVASVAALPASGNTVDDCYYISGTNQIGHWNGSSWDISANTITIGPCDSTDVNTGCPTTNYPGLSTTVPGCDPKVRISPGGPITGGCPAGAPPAYQGTTRALSNEAIGFTDFMQVVPAGAYNVNDWDSQLGAGYYIAGQATSGVGTNQLILAGDKCISVKDNTLSDFYAGIESLKATNTIFYNNTLRWMSGDAMEPYTGHRIWIVHNFYSDPTFIWAHQDFIQFGTSTGNEADVGYNDAAIENEAYQMMDQSNYFPREMQGINDTDGIYDQQYIADNILVAVTNILQSAGHYNVIVHNTGFGALGGGTGITAYTQHKVSADVFPLNDVLANNVGNGVSRDRIGAPCGNDNVTVGGNVSIPTVQGTNITELGNNVTCIGATEFSGATPGVYDGHVTWNNTDWQTNGQAYALFRGYHPLGPGSRGANNTTQTAYSPCILNNFTPTGTCPAGTNGIFDAHPNASYQYWYNGPFTINGCTTSSPTIAGQVSRTNILPSGQANGTIYLVQLATSGTAGVYQACSATSGGWNLVSARYSPPIIGAGMTLTAWPSGPRPIADQDSKGWATPPSSGAYENH